MKNKIVLNCSVTKDRYTDYLNNLYDYQVGININTEIEYDINLPENWNIGAIIGSSGSGKTSILKEFGEINNNIWNNNLPIISNFPNLEPNKVCELLSSVGFNSIPSWCKKYNSLSNGEKFRVDIAKLISQDKDVYLIDEFTSWIDRFTAISLCNSLYKYIKKNNKKLIIASCHKDILEWLRPDWIYDTDKKETIWGLLQRPKINMEIFQVKYKNWEFFKQHHYLSEILNKSSRCFMIYWNEEPIGFNAILAFPNGSFKNGWRESRLVVLPQYQGLGLGVKISDYFGSLISSRNNGRYYSRTRHPSMIKYRQNSKNWKCVKQGKYIGLSGKNRTKHGYSWNCDNREASSFLYIGPKASQEESKLFYENIIND